MELSKTDSASDAIRSTDAFCADSRASGLLCLAQLQQLRSAPVHICFSAVAQKAYMGWILQQIRPPQAKAARSAAATVATP
jgi:hypothetical protein